MTLYAAGEVLYNPSKNKSNAVVNSENVISRERGGDREREKNSF